MLGIYCPGPVQKRETPSTSYRPRLLWLWSSMKPGIIILYYRYSNSKSHTSIPLLTKHCNESQKIQSSSEIVNGMTNPRITVADARWCRVPWWPFLDPSVYLFWPWLSSHRCFDQSSFPWNPNFDPNVASKTTHRKLIHDNGYHLRGRWMFLWTFDKSPSRLAEKCDHRAVCVHQHLPGSVYTGWLLAERHGLWVRAIFARERCTTNEQFHF